MHLGLVLGLMAVRETEFLRLPEKAEVMERVFHPLAVVFEKCQGHIREQICALPVLLEQVTYNQESKRLLDPLKDCPVMMVEFLGSKGPSVENQNEENELLCFGQVVQ